jgi:hypothetical protein
MKIDISKKEVFNEVSKISSLEGSVIPERFENVWASEEDGLLLDSYWVEGYTSVIQSFKRYLKGETIEHNLLLYEKDEVFSIEVEMPARYNSLLDGNVATDVKMMIACNILFGWLQIRNPEAAEKYRENANGYSEDLKAKILYRVEPVSKMKNRDFCGEVIINPEYEYISRKSNDCIPLKQGSYECKK